MRTKFLPKNCRTNPQFICLPVNKICSRTYNQADDAIYIYGNPSNPFVLLNKPPLTACYFNEYQKIFQTTIIFLFHNVTYLQSAVKDGNSRYVYNELNSFQIKIRNMQFFEEQGIFHFMILPPRNR